MAGMRRVNIGYEGPSDPIRSLVPLDKSYISPFTGKKVTPYLEFKLTIDKEALKTLQDSMEDIFGERMSKEEAIRMAFLIPETATDIRDEVSVRRLIKKVKGGRKK